MSEIPPSFADYPREMPVATGSAERLQSLMEGYYAYGWLFLIHVVLSLSLLGISAALGRSGGIVYLAGLVVVMVAMGAISYPINAKVGYGAGWSKAGIVLASVVIAFGTICYGIIGYIVLQSLAATHIRKFGVRRRFFGFRKKDVKARVAELQALEASGRSF